MLLVLIFVFLGVVLLLGALVVHQSIKKEGRWGIRFGAPPTCPRCSNELPVTRFPSDEHEALWGGWTCACGAKLDKWGKERLRR